MTIEEDYAKSISDAMENLLKIMKIKNNIIDNNTVGDYMSTLYRLEKRLGYGHPIRKGDQNIVDGLLEMSIYLLKQIEKGEKQ